MKGQSPLPWTHHRLVERTIFSSSVPLEKEELEKLMEKS